MTERQRVSYRSLLYLRACIDWSVDWEIAKRLGDTPPMNPRRVRINLGRLVGSGLLQWSHANNTYCITDDGLKALRAHGECEDKEG